MVALHRDDPIDREWVSLERAERSGATVATLRWRIDLATRQQRIAALRPTGQLKVRLRKPATIRRKGV